MTTPDLIAHLLPESNPLISHYFDAGFQLLLCRPGGTEAGEANKGPLDMRTVAEKAQTAGRSGVYARTGDPATWTRWVREWHDHTHHLGPDRQAPNIGLAPGPSGLVCIDTDHMGARTAFEAMYRELTGEDCPPMSQSSPGKQNEDGSWVPDHHEGGHWFFRVPGGVPESVGNRLLAKKPAEISVIVRGYVLVAPSSRYEGAYEWQCTDIPWLPQPLADLIAAAPEQSGGGGGKGATPRRRDPALGRRITEWSMSRTWGELLLPLGWSEHRGAECGSDCTIWTRPGAGASSRSAIAHGPGCTVGGYHQQDPPLHVFTTGDDGPVGEWCAERGTQTISRFQLFALMHYGGDMGAAIRAEGLGTR